MAGRSASRHLCDGGGDPAPPTAAGGFLWRALGDRPADQSADRLSHLAAALHRLPGVGGQSDPVSGVAAAGTAVWRRPAGQIFAGRHRHHRILAVCDRSGAGALSAGLADRYPVVPAAGIPAAEGQGSAARSSPVCPDAGYRPGTAYRADAGRGHHHHRIGRRFHGRIGGEGRPCRADRIRRQPVPAVCRAIRAVRSRHPPAGFFASARSGGGSAGRTA